MGMSDSLSRLGSQTIPAIAQGIFADRMNIVSQASTTDDFGGAYPGTASTSFSSVPVSCHPETTSGEREIVGDAPKAKQRYLLRFPAYHNGSRITLDDTHRLVVLSRGAEPQKTFVIHKVRDHSGGMYTVVGELA